MKYTDCEGKKAVTGMLAMYCGCLFDVKQRNGKMYLKIKNTGEFHEREFIRYNNGSKCVYFSKIDSEDLYLLEEE